MVINVSVSMGWRIVDRPNNDVGLCKDKMILELRAGWAQVYPWSGDTRWIKL